MQADRKHAAGPRRRWWHRIPVRARHHWRPVALFAAFLALTLGVFGSSRVVPYVTGDDRYEAPAVTEDIAGNADLFDTSVAHSVQLTFREDDYRRILTAWYDEGEKEHLQADVVIDGARIDDVGVRLKGNSTLMSLQDPDADPGERRRGPGGMRPLEGRELPEGVPPPGQGGGDGPAGPPGGGIGSVTLSADEPENLPYLISFDEFAEGRLFQGRSEIAVRPSSGSSTVALNESVALAMVDRTGQTGQAHTYAALTVNDRPATARLIVEHPDESYAEARFAGDGVLYKSRASSSFTDQGDDPTAYEDDVEQINRIGSQDLQPVIDLIQWVQRATDEEFAAELGDHLDVGSFARYLATQNLLLNVDDMAGPGKNYYLRYDLGTERFEVIAWDLNLAASGDPTTGPHDEVSMAALFGGRGPGGGAPPEGAAVPEDGAAAAPPGGGPGPGGPGGMLQGHLLKDRFLATPAFTAAYDEAYRELHQQIYGSGAAVAALDRAVAAATGAAAEEDRATILREADDLRALLDRRAEAVAADPLLHPAS
ncbi:Spore coat protein CotH [Pseudonocardia ammonioxydans]|uniref:Spore coat protein CotH n=1 Tax=Pseudonocardia ammonioxydans TaxID=260086 RepID=A0A1I4Y1L4_PSUAM|nr:CotH kinase family protein [Pseudonocardia ammonioxydans]SFN31380.1 Spore coat protein CotH [Pseudonocardia ammonioxydans]